MGKGKPDLPRAASPAEVARTLLARAREQGAAADAGLALAAAADPRAAPTQAAEARTASGVQPSRRLAPTVPAPTSGPAPGSQGAPAGAGDERYVRQGLLGQGGMGRVEEVFDRVLGRPVATKSLLHDADERRATMLVAEAQTCAQLEHPSIVPVYDLAAADDGRPFYTMRVVRGRTLRDVLDDNAHPEREHVPLAQVLGVLRQICLAVDYAHSRGVIHRDLKPDNVIVGEFGEVYVVDWGIAHLVEGSAVRRAEIGTIVAGTPAYMAPEQLAGGDVDARADVFALGAMLYEILTGARPFADESLHGVRLRRSRSVELPPSLAGDRLAPAFFDDLVLGCLAPDRKARPGRARVLASAIDQFLDAERERSERAREAQAHTERGDAAAAEHQCLAAEAAKLEAQAEDELGALPGHAGADQKRPAWELATRARRLRAEAARALARAETEYTRALGRSADHAPARAALAALHYRGLLAAEEAGDEEQAAQALALARVYDDGALALELANQGEVTVESAPAAALVTLQRYEPSGPLLVPGEPRSLGASPTPPLLVEAGSYLVTAVLDDRELRYPLLVRRAEAHRLRLRLPEPNELPAGMVLIPGGPFLMLRPGARRLGVATLDDFALDRFPVTFRQYARFLDALDPAERERRTPRAGDGSPALVFEGGAWRLGEKVLQGAGRKVVAEAASLDVPVAGIRWFDAAAYARFAATNRGIPLRLPTDAEWEKAMRGADGRPFPMGTRVDPSFARLRESRSGPATPEPVGAFPLDASPFGVRDLAGGVGDWTSTFADGALAPVIEQEDDVTLQDRQAYWRGGTWSSAALTSPMRYAQAACTRGLWIGFRLALSLDAAGSSELVTEPMARG